MTWTTFFTDPGMTLLLIGLVLIVLVLIKWQIQGDTFDLRDLLLDTKTRRVTPEKFGVMTALAVSSWGFVCQIQDGKMTEYYFSGYILLWSGLRAYLKGKEKKSTDDNPKS